MDRHIRLIFLAEWHVNVRRQTLAEYILLYASHNPNHLGIAAPFGLITRQQPDVLPNRIATGPQTLGSRLIQNNHRVCVRTLAFILLETAAP
jgi:hypothetical protein